MSDPWLAPEEVAKLTGKQRISAQVRMLVRMGIPFRPNGIGLPLIERSAVLSKTETKRAAREPNWDAMKKDAA